MLLAALQAKPFTELQPQLVWPGMPSETYTLAVVGQLVQEATFVELEYVPAAQFVQTVVSAVREHEPLLKVPAGHIAQDVHEEAPAAAHELPDTQVLHTVLAVTEQAEER